MTVRDLRRSTRGRAPLGSALVALCLLTGCAAGDGSAEATDAAGSNLLPPAEGKTEYPLTLTTAWGETVLEERPERIVALTVTGGGGTEELVALGVTPVGATGIDEGESWTMEAVPGEIEEFFDTTDGVPFEQVASSDPDLIVYMGPDLGESFERLASIAPVLGSETAESQPDWLRSDMMSIGRALDLADAAQDALDVYDSFFERVRTENPEFADLTASYLINYGEEWGTFYSSAPGTNEAQLLLDLGFAPNPLAEQFAGEQTVSPELISQIDADVIVLSANFPDQLHLLTDDPLFQELGAVQNDRVAILEIDTEGYGFDGEHYEGGISWATGHGGQILGKQWAAEQLIPILRSTLGFD